MRSIDAVEYEAGNISGASSKPRGMSFSTFCKVAHAEEKVRAQNMHEEKRSNKMSQIQSLDI